MNLFQIRGKSLKTDLRATAELACSEEEALMIPEEEAKEEDLHRL